MRFIRACAVLLAIAAPILADGASGGTPDKDKAALAALLDHPQGEAAYSEIQRLMTEAFKRGTAGENSIAPGIDDRALVDRLAGVLLDHHADRPGVQNAAIMYVFTLAPAEQTNYMRRLYDATTSPEVRRGLAGSLLNTYYARYNSRAAAPEERVQMRREVSDLVRRLQQDMPGDALLLRHAARTLSAQNYSVGSPLPDIQCPIVNGGKTDSPARHRGKVVVIDIWATWCPPCVAGQPALVALKQEMKGRPFEIFALSMDHKPADVLAHAKKQAMPWINGYIGMNAPILETLGVNGYPTYFVLDAEGVIRARTGEFDTATQEYVRTLVAELEAGRGK